MSQREKVILAITIAVVLLAGALYLVPEATLERLRGDGSEVDIALDQFSLNMELVETGPAIRKAYRRVETQLPERLPNSTPEATFTNEVARKLQDLGWDRPTVLPAKPALIDGVDDYYYIDLEVRLSGTHKKTIDVMLDFARTGLLVRGFQMTKKNMDQDVVDLTVILSRLAKADADKMEKLRKRG